MAEPDLYSLFSGAPDAAQQAAAMAAALRKQNALGQLGMLTGDKVLSPFGQSLMGGAEAGQGRLAQAGGADASRGLQRALQASQQGFSAEQSGLDRSARAREGGLNRALKSKAMGLKALADKDKADRDGKSGALKAETDLRDRFLGLPETKSAMEISHALRNIKGASANGAGDIRLLYSYLKILDPGSTVREGEFATAGKSGGLPGQLQGYFNQLTAQGILPDAVRKQVREEGTALASERLKGFSSVRHSFRGLAEQQGLDPNRVDIDLGLPSFDEAPVPVPSAHGTKGTARADATGGAVAPRDPRNLVKKESTPEGTTLYYYANGDIEEE